MGEEEDEEEMGEEEEEEKDERFFWRLHCSGLVPDLPSIITLETSQDLYSTDLKSSRTFVFSPIL